MFHLNFELPHQKNFVSTIFYFKLILFVDNALST